MLSPAKALISGLKQDEQDQARRVSIADHCEVNKQDQARRVSIADHW